MKKNLWLIPAMASLGFFLFSVRVIAAEGPFGFLTEHARNGWGAQIGIDLVNSLVVALFFAAPVARRHGVRPLPWIFLTIFTGSVGLLAFAARILYARSASTREPVADQAMERQPRTI